MEEASYIPTAGILVFKESSVLLIKHTDKSGHPTGTWGLPAGRVDQGETAEEAAIRELEEEVGLRVEKNSLRKIPIIYQVAIPRKDGKNMRIEMHTFVVDGAEGEIKKTEEAIPQWIKFDKISELKLPVNIKNIIYEGRKLLNYE